MKTSTFQKQLKRNASHFYHRFYPGRLRLRVLIVSSHPREQKALSSALKEHGCFVHQVTDKESLIQLFTQKKQYDVVIVSDHFYAAGLGFFPLYFRAGNKKHRPYLIYLGKGEALGFDARLRSAFLPEELFSLFQ